MKPDPRVEPVTLAEGGMPFREEPNDALLIRGLRTVAVRGAAAVGSFAFAIVVARVLLPSERGDFALLQTAAGIAALIANFAVAKAIIYRVGKGEMGLGEASTAGATLGVASGLIGLVVILPVVLATRKTLLPSIPVSSLFVAVGVATPLLIREYLGGVLVSAGRSVAFVVAQICQPVVGAVMLLATSAVISGSALSWAVVAWVSGVLLSTVLTAVFCATRAGGWERPTWQNLKRLSVLGMRTYPAFIARFLNLRIDQVVLRILTNASTLGIYAVAISVGELLIRIPNLFLLAIGGELSASSPQEAARLVCRFARWLVLVLLPPVVLVSALSPVGVPLLFGHAYSRAAVSVLLLLPGMLFYAPAIVISEYFMVQRGRPSRAATAAGAGILTSILFNLALAPVWGAAGASVASTLSYGVMLAVALIVFHRDSGVRAREVFAFSREDVEAVWRSLRGVLHSARPRRQVGL
jgi:O-antigen/teichoic acid export membrane protein